MKLALALLALPSLVAAAPCARKPELLAARVEDGTKEMQQLAAEAKADKAAAAAGITASGEQWSSNGHVYADSFVKGTDRDKLVVWLGTRLKKYDAGVRAIHLGEVSDGKDRYWRTYYVSTQAVITDRDVVDARVVTPTPDNPGLQVTLGEKGKAAFAAATKDAQGHKLASEIVGKGIVSAPVIDTEVPGGKLVITTPGTTAERSAEVTRLAAAFSCKP